MYKIHVGNGGNRYINLQITSTRAAASTAMKENLLPVEDILRTAGWSNVQTFVKFYNKPIDSARTTSDVIFNTRATNVVPDGL